MIAQQRISRTTLRSLYQRLLREHGPQHWWPADSPFEVMIGAVLVQGTHWRNASRAIAQLRAVGPLRPDKLAALPAARVAELIRPSGYFRVKTARLQALCRWIVAGGGLERLRRLDTATLRRELLGVHGIGAETADAILLYAFDRPVFVVDAYARRLFARYGLFAEHGDAALAQAVLRLLGPDVAALNELHALIVAHGKTICTARPCCERCVLHSRCRWPRRGRAGLTGSRTAVR